MMDTHAITIKLAADVADVLAKFRQVEGVAGSSMASIAKSASHAKAILSGLAAGLTGAAFTGWIKGAIDTADETSKMAQKIGVATKDVAGLQLAFRQAGATDAFGSSMAKLAKSVEGGSQAFDAMGISTKASDGTMKSSRQLLGEVADKFASYEGSIKKSALAQEIFGKSGADLIPLLNAGAAGLDEYDAIAQKLGLTISTETAQAAEKFNDTMDLVGLGTKGVATDIAAELLPTLSGLAGQFLGTMTEGDRLKKTADFLSTALKGLYITGLGVIEIFSTVGTTVGGVAAIIGAALSGDFESAAQTFRDLKSDIGKGWKDTAAQMSAAWNATSNASVDSMAATQAALKGAAPSVTDHAKSVKVVADEYAKLSAEIAKQLALSQAELDGNGKLEASEKYRITTLEKLIEQYQAGKITLEEYIDLEAKMNDVQGVMEKAEAQAKAAKAAQAAYAESLQYQDDLNKALREEEHARNKIRMAVGANTVAAEEAQALAELETQTVFASAEDRKRILDYYRIELNLRKAIAAINSTAGLDQAGRDELIAIETANSERLKGVADMGAAMQSTTSIWQSIDQTAHSVWTNVLQGGQDAFTKIGNTLKSAVLDLLYQMTVKKWILSVGASVSGSGAAASSLSSAGGIGSGVSTLGNIGAMGGQFMNGLSAWGEGGSVLGMMSNPGLYSGMEMLGAASPFIAAGIAIYSLLSSGGTKPSIEGGYSSAGDPGTNGKSYVNGFYGGAMDLGSKSIVEGMTKSYTDTVKLLGGKAGTFTASQFTGVDQNGHQSAVDMSAFVNGKAVYNRYADLGTNKVGSSDAEIKAAVDLSSKKALIEALKATDIGPVLNDYLAGVKTQGLEIAQIDAILSDVTGIGTFQKALKGLPFEQLSTLSVVATKDLADLAGGLDALSANLSTYYQEFYSDAERTAVTTQQITSTLGDLGLAMPATREELRKLVDAQDLTTEAGLKNYNALMSVAGAFAQVTPAAQAATATVTSYVSNLKNITSAYNANLTAQQSYLKGLVSAGDSVRKLLDSLQVGTNASTSPQSRLDAARSQYLADLNKARAGDYEAYSRVATTAQTYIGAGSDMYASSTAQKAIIAQVQSELANLPAVAKYDENLAALNRIEAAIKASAINTVDAINSDKVDTLQAIHAMTLATTAGFDSFDANQSGALDFTELKAALGVGDRLTQELINAIDTNGDGQISRLEIIAANTNGLAELDRINSTINQFDWSAANKPAAIAGFSNIAKSNNWSVAQIAAASGYSTSEISKLFAGTGVGAGVGGSPTSVSEQIDAAIRQYDWSDAAKQASAAAFANVASSKGWSIGQIAGVSGYGASDLSKLFAGTALGTGIAGTGSSATASTTAAATAPNYAVIAGIVNSMNWAEGNKAASATALYGLSLASGWTQQMISAATGNSFASIQALFASAGIPNFETGGDHTGGLRLVGERGPELEVTGPSRIYSASQTAAMLGSGSKEDPKPTLKQITALLERLLAHQAAANNTAIAKQERIAQATELTANATKLEGARA